MSESSPLIRDKTPFHEIINGWYSWVVVFFLFVAYVLNQADRNLLPVYASLLTSDVHMSDTQLGLLLGPAFTFFYIAAGLPVARLADKWSRKNVMVLGILLWSLMTYLTSISTLYWHLLVTRLLVGLGESACSPPAFSLISDYFSSEHRGTAISFYNFAIYVGIGLGYGLGGISGTLGWRGVFMWAGLVGVGFSVAFFFAVKEPERGQADKYDQQKAQMASSDQESYSELTKSHDVEEEGEDAQEEDDDSQGEILNVLKLMWTNKIFFSLLLSASCRQFAGYALASWTPTFFSRIFGVGPEIQAEYLSWIIPVGGAIGVVVGGWGSDKLAKKIRGARALVAAAASALALPFMIVAITSEDYHLSFMMLLPAYICSEMWSAPAATLVQEYCPPKARTMASAVYLFTITLIGGAAPLIVGAINDSVHDINFLRTSLLWVVAICYTMSSLLFVNTARLIRKE